MESSSRYVRWFDEISIADVPLVGGKNASLGEMYRELVQAGVKVPPGFAITAEAYKRILVEGQIVERIEGLLQSVSGRDPEHLAAAGESARRLVEEAAVPSAIEEEILAAYERLTRLRNGADSVAVRSSATAEDLPDASFAGQQESFLNVRGGGDLLAACRACFASVFTDRAISYRVDRGFPHRSVALSVGVQAMVRSDLAASGVMFTLDTESGFRDVVLVNSSYGLGENIVKGTVSPDEFYVFKPTLRSGHQAILRRRVGGKQLRMVLADGQPGNGTRNVPVPAVEREVFSLRDADVLELSRYAVSIEEHYSRKAGKAVAMDIEWAKDGLSGQLFIVQARPETVESRRSTDVVETHVLERRSEVLAVGKSIGRGIGAGVVHVILSPSEMAAFRTGDVLVAPTTTPDWEPVMKRAAAIVTDRGGRTCHAAIVARELGIPAVVGTGDATSRLSGSTDVTVSCAEGDSGYVYRGTLPRRVDRMDVGSIARPRTQIMLNVGDPDRAFGLAALPNDGVGLARIEFVVNNSIGVHPMALLHPERVDDPNARVRIAELTAGYPDKAEYFIDRLAQGIAMIAAAFHPKPVIVRLSDFKSNEYAKLVGGAGFEPKEENPMIGLRGASRYTHPSYREAFALECRAIRRVRENMGLPNVRVMIPFCRTVEEGGRVLAEMALHGLERGRAGLEVYVMCEIPNNVLRIDAFCRLFDGISIGSNDLTQLTLGVDRDSELVAFEFDERDPGVLAFLRMAVEGAKRNGRHVSICGQAPSDYPEIAEMLVRLGIEAISLNADSLLKTTLRVLEIEATQARERALPAVAALA
jgi:pyruvate, water dikinase